MKRVVRKNPLVLVEFVNGLWECYVERSDEIELYQFRVYEDLVSFLKSLRLSI